MKPHASTKFLALACVSAVAAGFAPSSPVLDQNKCANHPDRRRRRLPTTLRASDRPDDVDYGALGQLDAIDYVKAHDYAAYDVFEGASRQIAGMEYWAAECGVQRAEGFKLAEENGGKEVHAVTTADVPAGRPVLYVPEALILSSDKAIAELRGPEMGEAERFVRAKGGEAEYRQWYLMLKILNEIQKGRDSLWFYWLDSMPRYYENAASMTDYCLQCLPPLMRLLAGEEREKQRRLSKEALTTVPFLCDELKNHPRDFCLWAYQIVYTRSVETEGGDLRIVPVADYFNHGSDYTEIAPYYDEAGNYYAYTTYDVPAGSPLRISYADPRNPSFLLARYGFLDENCPASYCKLLPPTVNQDMLDLGYSHDRMLFYKTGEVADEVWDIFLYTHLGSTNNIEDQQTLMRAHREGDYNTKLALHEKYYPATSAALLNHVDGFIEDVDKVIRKSAAHPIYIKNEHPRLPLIHRHNQFVREVFANVRSRYAPSDSRANWQEATRITVEECDDRECALAECVRDVRGEWACEGGLAPNWDGSEREKSQTVVAAQ